MSPIVEQLKKLAKDHHDLPSFYRQSIQLIAEQLDAQAIVVWDCEALPFRPVHQYNRDSSRAVKVGVSEQRHLELLTEASNHTEVLVAEAGSPQSPDDSNLLFCTVQRGDQSDVVEVFVFPTASSESHSRKGQILRACCEALGQSWAIKTTTENQGSFVRHDQANGNRQSNPQGNTQIARLDQFTTNVYQSIDSRTTHFNIANEARSFLKCDRVTVVNFDRKARVSAISGLARFNRRSNAVTGLQRLATAVLKTGEAFRFPAADSPPLPQIQERLDPYLAENVTRSIVILPIHREPIERAVSPDNVGIRKSNPVIGGVIFEHFANEWNSHDIADSTTVAGRHIANAFRNSYQHNSLFLLPVWRQLGMAKTLLGRTYLSRSLGVASLAFLLIACMCFVPARNNISGNGKLVPIVRRTVFAQVEGTIDSVRVDSGDSVVSGQLLIEMSSSDLKIQLSEIKNKIDLAKQQIESLDLRRISNNSGAFTAEQARQEDLERASLLSQLESYRNEHELFQTEIERLNVSSPLTGTVTTNDLDRRLLNRPVKSGQALLEIADKTGDWRIELDLPDRRIGHLQSAMENMGEELKVTFMLSAEPGRTHSGTIYHIANSTQVNPESGHTLRIMIRPDNPEDLRAHKVGTDVTVKVDCGECSLGYRCWRDVGEFFESNVLFHFK